MNDATTDTTATTVTRTELYTATQYAELEARLERTTEQLNSAFLSISRLNDRLVARERATDAVKDYLLENYDDLEMHADEIASLLDIELTREVEYAVSMSVTVTVTVAPGEDAESLIADNLYVDANHGNIQVDDYTVDYSNEA
jgi:hypothetical protein